MNGEMVSQTYKIMFQKVIKLIYTLHLIISTATPMSNPVSICFSSLFIYLWKLCVLIVKGLFLIQKFDTANWLPILVCFYFVVANEHP